MQHSISTFFGAGNLSLYCQSWLPDTSPRAAILIVHGLGEHSGRYLNLVNALVPQGYAIYAFDLRGHRRSPGPRGHINRWSEYHDDISAYLKLIITHHPALPVFLYGHSLGALIALTYIMDPPPELHGAVISSAPIEIVGAASPAVIFMARLLSGIWPSFALKTIIKGAILSHDPEVVKTYDNDPLIHGYASARFGTEGLSRSAWVTAHPELVKLPILIMHGEDDTINTVAGARRYFAALDSSDKTLITYPATLHEPHNDLDHVKVLADVASWLKQRL